MVERVSLSATTGTSGVSQLVSFCPQIRKERKEAHTSIQFIPFHLLWEPSPWNDTTYVQDRSLLLS